MHHIRPGGLPVGAEVASGPQERAVGDRNDLRTRLELGAAGAVVAKLIKEAGMLHAPEKPGLGLQPEPDLVGGYRLEV